MTTQISGTTGVSQVQPAVVVDASLNLTANSPAIKTALNASGNAPIFACRAWVNFNGTGTPAIRGSGNVSSLTDNGVGNYTINLATPITLNASVVCSGTLASAPPASEQVSCVSYVSGTSSVRYFSFNPNTNAAQDFANAYVQLVN
jgi:hypothetical protein